MAKTVGTAKAKSEKIDATTQEGKLKAIQTAMVHLLKSKPFEKITVQDILDETPVSRATFYKHYRDKYEIVEKMQAEFLSVQERLVTAMTGVETWDDAEFLRTYSDRYRESLQSLLKVQTENVNLTHGLIRELARLYRKNAAGPYVNLEAPLYGAIITALQIICLHNGVTHLDDSPGIIINTMFALLGLQGDREAEAYLRTRMLANSKAPE